MLGGSTKMAICNDDLISAKPKHLLIAFLIIYFFVGLYYFWCFGSSRGVSGVPGCSSVPGLITYGAKLLSADWLRQRAFFVNHEGTFGNQEGMIT